MPYAERLRHLPVLSEPEATKIIPESLLYIARVTFGAQINVQIT